MNKEKNIIIDKIQNINFKKTLMFKHDKTIIFKSYSGNAVCKSLKPFMKEFVIENNLSVLCYSSSNLFYDTISITAFTPPFIFASPFYKNKIREPKYIIAEND